MGQWRVGLLALLLAVFVPLTPARAQALQLNRYCQISQADATRKETLRRAVFEQGNEQARSQYEALVAEHARALANCRNATWPRDQAVWLRQFG